MTTIECLAPAKINLTLHVTGQRDDGYHLLDSLVAFCALGDVVRVEPGTGLTISGPLADGVPTDAANSVLKAAALFGAPDHAFHLEKHLPHAAGIGGGSSDAAATLRALATATGRAIPADVTPLGADVPVCLEARPTRMEGIGEVLTPVPDLPEAHLVLINPKVPMETPPVFRALTQKSNPAMPMSLPQWRSAEELADWLATMRNDLEAPATTLAPVIGDVIAALRSSPDCLFARMSGSGATCFGIYAETSHADAAAASLRADHPGWWMEATRLLSAGAPPRTLPTG